MTISILPSIALGSITTLAFLLGELNGSSQIRLGEAVAAFIFVAGLVAWLSRKLQKIEDDLAMLKNDLASRPCQLKGECSKLRSPTD